MADIKVLVLLGSLRAASINRQLAELAAESAPDGIDVTVYEGLGELPFYNEDLDTDDAPVMSNSRASPAVCRPAICWSVMVMGPISVSLPSSQL